ncbi:Hydroxypyruvate reductase protein [Dioscorea alata]|uniref:Hydroxypyruvate reductase protein n=1 Tax=Dioscorea alata TaxID=55571 RepID=A0ACB7UHA9_DIOAL|nr:Hydroxypyruvate reductase protein [Dioscorea alata]
MAESQTLETPDLHPQTILILNPVAPAVITAVSHRFNLLKLWESSLSKPQFLAAHAASTRALIVNGSTPVDAEILDALPRLQLIFSTSAGLNHIDLPECARRGVSIANAPEIFSEDVADYAVGLLIDVLRRVSSSDRYVRKGLWPVNGDFPLGFKLGGKRVGIVGLGSIGSKIAKRLDAFGCIISYNSRTKKPSVPYTFYANIIDLASNNDVLVVSCALTSETYHIIDKDVMETIGKKGIIINVGRGGLVDEKELVRRLMEGEIGGAGLDVFENGTEVPKELFLMENVVLSPHKAVHTTESITDLKNLVIGNLEAFFANKPLISPVQV